LLATASGESGVNRDSEKLWRSIQSSFAIRSAAANGALAMEDGKVRIDNTPEIWQKREVRRFSPRCPVAEAPLCCGRLTCGVRTFIEQLSLRSDSL
jgi:hypothetical protein